MAKQKPLGYMRRLQTNPSGIAQLSNEKGERTDQVLEIADTLGRYFQEVYTREDLSNNIHDLSTSIVPPPEQFSDLDICLDEGSVEKALARLQSDKSPGPDGVHPMLLKECAKFLANPVSKIFKKSLDSGKIPQDWKQADIAPIFKKGNRTDAANYRPVSLTSVVCKVMESLIKQQLVRHLESNNMISKHQHGFRKGRSCLTNLLETFEEWTTALDEGHGIDVVYLDYRKAFDTVPHKRLVEKLKLFGIAGATLKWIEDFLQGRTTRVIVRNNSSKWLEVLSGVPQGSVLGPLLFLIFINDLPDWISCSVKLFADDTKVWKIIDSVDDQKVLQKDLDNMMAWSRIWLLWFNPEKCKIMHIGHSLNTVYHLGETERQILIVSKEEKDLGITVTNDLKSAVQCSKAAAKARSIAGLIRRNFRRLEKPEFLALYKAYIRPHMEFCVQAWSPHLRKDIETLERVQRSATKMVVGLKHLTYEERLKELGLTSLEKRRTRGDLIEVYKVMTAKENLDPDQFFKKADNAHNLRGHTLKLYTERSRLNTRKYFFTQRVVAEWNGLPQYVVDAPSINAFKNRLDSHWSDMGI